MKRFWMAVFLTALLTGPAGAQESPQCDGAAYAELATDVSVIVDDLATGDAGVLDRLIDELMTFRAGCTGLSFEGDSNQVLGPVEIPAGVYRATVTTDGYMVSDLTVMDGTCEAGIMGLFLLTEGRATDGAETVVESEGCTALIEISNTTAPWTLVFERLG